MGIADLLDRPSTGDSPDSELSGNSRTISGGFPGDSGPAPLSPDPAPGRARKPAKATQPKATAAKARDASITVSKPQVVAEIAEELQMWLGILAASWALRDPVCAPVLNDQARAIAESVAVLIGRSERLLSLAHGGGLFSDIGRALLAISPVVMVVRAHHVTKTAEEPNSDDALAGYPPFSGA